MLDKALARLDGSATCTRVDNSDLSRVLHSRYLDLHRGCEAARMIRQTCGRLSTIRIPLASFDPVAWIVGNTQDAWMCQSQLRDIAHLESDDFHLSGILRPDCLDLHGRWQANQDTSQGLGQSQSWDLAREWTTLTPLAYFDPFVVFRQPC